MVKPVGCYYASGSIVYLSSLCDGEMRVVTTTYEKKDAPTIGFIMTTLEAEFDKKLKEKVRNRYKNMFNRYIEQGVVHKNSQFYGSCEDEKDIVKACDKLTDIRADGIIYHPLTWPAGETITALSTYRYLIDIPIFVSASPEIFPSNESVPHPWPLNSDCAKIFANSIFYKLDRKTMWGTGLPEDKEYQKLLYDFFNVCQLIRRTKQAKIAVIGNIMDDFPESFYNPMTVRRELGIRVLEVDSSVLFTLFKDGAYPQRNLKIESKDMEAELKNLKEKVSVKVNEDVLTKTTRLYLAYREIIQSIPAEGAVFRCAPEMQEKHSVVVCGALARLLDNGVIFSGGCEGDVLNTVTGLLQYYASGKPTTCLDWIDKPGAAGKGTYTLLHCGNACKSMIDEGKGCLDYHQAWTYEPLGYTIEGPLKKGAVTLARLRENRQGKLELLIVEGESITEEMQIRGNFGLVHIGEERLQQLENELNGNGWPHHLSLGWGHHGDVLEMISRLLGDIKITRL
jgi:L-fucose isomerase-like protein